MKYINCITYFSLIFLAFLIAGCEKDDGIPPESKYLDNHDPGINISFINKTEIDSLINLLNDDSSKLNTSRQELERVNEKLKDENLLLQDSIALAATKKIEEDSIKNYNDRLSKNDKDLAKLKEEKAIIKSLFIVDSPINKNLSFKEAKVFRFPFRPDQSTTEYKILIEGNNDEFNLVVNYELATHVVDRIIKRKAEKIVIGENNFIDFKLDTVSIIDEHLYKAYY